MNHRITLTLSLALAVFFTSHVNAQQPHHPEISIGHSGIKTLKADIEFLLSLTSEKEQQQLVNIIDFIDLLVFGLDEERPMRVDILSGTTPPTYVIWGAYGVLAELKDDNIAAQFVLKDAEPNLSELLPDDTGWFRVLPSIKYAILILTNPADHILLKQIILKLGDPLPAIQPLLLNNANVGVQLLNKALTPEDQQKRRDSFAEIRSNRMAALQKRPSESATEFELRKGMISIQLDEIERLMVESLNTSARILLDRENASSVTVFASKAIEETSMAKSIGLFGKRADTFASVPKQEGSILSLRANHPFDELRQTNYLKIIDLLRNDVVARLKQDKQLSPEAKEASQQLFDGVMEVVKDGIASGNINAFVETTVNDDGRFITIGATSAKDAQRLDDTLALIAKTGKGNKVTPEVAVVGKVKIHEVRLAEGYFPLFDRIFGVEQVVYIGTSPDLVWMGIGKDALEPMKAAITDLKEPGENDVVLSVGAQLQPWAKRAIKLLEDSPEPETLDDQQTRRDQLRTLKIAVESFEEKDDILFDTKVDDGTVTGKVFVNTGVLKFIGRQMSLYSKNNLQ